MATYCLIEDNAGFRYIIGPTEGWGGLEVFGLDEQGAALYAVAHDDTENFASIQHFTDTDCDCPNEHYLFSDLPEPLHCVAEVEGHDDEEAQTSDR